MTPLLLNVPPEALSIISGAINRSIRERCVVLAVSRPGAAMKVEFTDHVSVETALQALRAHPYRAYAIAEDGSLRLSAFPAAKE